DFWSMRQSNDDSPRNTNRLFAEGYLGLASMLMEEHIPYVHLFDNTLDKDTLDQFKVILLPNVACLSEEACAALIGYVERGGRLIATYETSLYDEWGNRRPDFALANLFGVSYRRTVDKVAREPHFWVREVTDPAINDGQKGLTWQTRRTMVSLKEGAQVLANETSRLFGPPEADAFEFDVAIRKKCPRSSAIGWAKVRPSILSMTCRRATSSRRSGPSGPFCAI
ncbi:MAG: beta-galactosidase trimerization domain-containing protein, partial [bacterium]|nr:beta-galactosidase trimerization domain-containing protein [bacterium]